MKTEVFVDVVTFKPKQTEFTFYFIILNFRAATDDCFPLVISLLTVSTLG